MEDYQNKLESLLIDTAKTLCDLYKAQNNKENGVWNFGHVNDVDNQHMQLIFPKNGTEVRVSEQEARFCLARYIEKSKIFFYSIETPTNKSYSFSSKSSVRHYMRARTDMTLYDQKHNPLFDIELKAENPAETQSEGSTKEPKTRNFGNYSKDFFKLIMDDYDDKEKRCGVWFQVFTSGENSKAKREAIAKNIKTAIDKLEEYTLVQWNDRNNNEKDKIRLDKAKIIEGNKKIVLAFCELNSNNNHCYKLINNLTIEGFLNSEWAHKEIGEDSNGWISYK